MRICPGCKKPLGHCVAESQIYGSSDIPDICETCFEIEEEIVDRVGTNDPSVSTELADILKTYRSR